MGWRIAFGLGAYNAVFFTQALVLTEFFDVTDDRAPLYIIPLAIGNFLGP